MGAGASAGKNLNAKFEVAAEEKKKEEEEETPNGAKKSQTHALKKAPKKVPDSFMIRLAKTFGILRNKASVVVVGLDNSGKTTLLNYLKPDHGMMLKEVTPTIGFTLEKFRRGKLDFTCFDMSGQGKYRSLWEKHYENCDAIIWVVDASDPLRMCVVKDEFNMMLDHDSIKTGSAPILFFANKMDLVSAKDAASETVLDELELAKIRDRPWHVSSCNAVSGEGVSEGLDWLVGVLAKSKQ